MSSTFLQKRLQYLLGAFMQIMHDLTSPLTLYERILKSGDFSFLIKLLLTMALVAEKSESATCAWIAWCSMLPLGSDACFLVWLKWLESELDQPSLTWSFSNIIDCFASPCSNFFTTVHCIAEFSLQLNTSPGSHEYIASH